MRRIAVLRTNCASPNFGYANTLVAIPGWKTEMKITFLLFTLLVSCSRLPGSGAVMIYHGVGFTRATSTMTWNKASTVSCGPNSSFKCIHLYSNYSINFESQIFEIIAPCSGVSIFRNQFAFPIRPTLSGDAVVQWTADYFEVSYTDRETEDPVPPVMHISILRKGNTYSILEFRSPSNIAEWTKYASKVELNVADGKIVAHLWPGEYGMVHIPWYCARSFGSKCLF